MVEIDDSDKTILCTRGDYAAFDVKALFNGGSYVFRAGDVIRFTVTEKKDCSAVVLRKDFTVSEASESVTVSLSGSDTKIGGIISKPVDYWYEVELNPDTNPQTIIGYDKNGPKIFKLFPEGKDAEE